MTILAGITTGQHTNLHIIRNGTLTAQMYEDEILRPHVKSYTADTGNSFQLMKNKASAHKTRLVENFLEDETLQLVELLAFSPKLIPIEHVCSLKINELS